MGVTDFHSGVGCFTANLTYRHVDTSLLNKLALGGLPNYYNKSFSVWQGFFYHSCLLSLCYSVGSGVVGAGGLGAGGGKSPWPEIIEANSVSVVLVFIVKRGIL